MGILLNTWLNLVHEQRATNWFACLRVFVHGIVENLDETITQLDVLSANCRYRFVVPSQEERF